MSGKEWTLKRQLKSDMRVSSKMKISTMRTTKSDLI